ncbi:uncharacterized protein [Watersipora subatra]|uniref:uncharacterized protein n=1 Tax=Watersipora subatra TaxID=2589382 RepID=UPI00355BEA90
MGSILEEVERTISKEPNCRTDEEINRLLPWFRKKSEVFRLLKPDAVTDIIRNCEIIKRPKDSIIVRQNDKGNCFFIMLTGKVSVYITNRDDDDTVDDEIEGAVDSDQPLGLPTDHETMATCSGNADSTEKLSAANIVPNKEILPELLPRPMCKRNTQCPPVEAFHLPAVSGALSLDRNRYGQCVAAIGDGKSFGELALLKKNCIRNATIITDAVTQLLVVNRQLYNRCIRESQEKEFIAKQMFVHTSEYFNGWNLRSKRQFAMSLHLRTFTYGTPIVCQGQPLDYIYFLQSGQCRVMIDPSMHKHQYPSYSLELQQKSAPASNAGDASDYEPPQIFRRGRCKGYTVKGYDICLIGEFNMIGDIELSTNLPTYMQSVTCEQYTEAFAIDLRNYERLVTRRHTSTGRYIAHNALVKLTNRAQRFPSIHLMEIIAQRFAHLYLEYERLQKQRDNKQTQKAKETTISRRKAARPANREELNGRVQQEPPNIQKKGFRVC